MPTQLYTSKTAAAALGCSDARIRQLCGKHENIGKKLGFAWLLTPQDLTRIRKLLKFQKK